MYLSSEVQRLGAWVMARPVRPSPPLAMRVARAGLLHVGLVGHYRLTHWNLRRAPVWPGFLRSLLRGSRFMKPARLRVGRSRASNP